MAEIVTEQSVQKSVVIDALPLVDQEYDYPVIKDEVNRLIEEEMKNFDPSNYLSKINTLLPDEELDRIVERIQQGVQNITIPRIDANRYVVKQPDTEDIEAWKEAVRKAKMAFSYQEYQLYKLEDFLEDESIAKYTADFVAGNKESEKYKLAVEVDIQTKQRELFLLHQSRLQAHQKAAMYMNKFSNRYNDSIYRKMQCEVAYSQLVHRLKIEKGIDYEQVLAEKERQIEARLEEGDNSTLQEYEKVNTHGDEMDVTNNDNDEQDYEQNEQSKRRRVEK